MKKLLVIASVLLLTIACNIAKIDSKSNNSKQLINQLINQWHRDVTEFNYDDYFNKMTDDAIFVGTDASEVWSKQEFQDFSKPYFDKKQTWDFIPISRNTYIGKNGQTAWFDELLDTWMGVCRGSGVVINDNGQWKIQHYVLSVAVPNEYMKKVVALKNKRDSLFIQSYKK